MVLKVIRSEAKYIAFIIIMAAPQDIFFENIREKESQSEIITNFRELLRLQSEECTKGEKSDRKTSGCKWTDGRFSKYKDCFETISDLELIPLYSKTAADRIRDALIEKAKCVDYRFNGSTEIPDILSKPNSERKVRYFINDLLTEFVNQNNLCLRIEETLKIRDLPTSIADYVIFTKTNKILGCVEAKKGGKWTRMPQFSVNYNFFLCTQGLETHCLA